jgi:hypothetical protein
MTPEEYKTNIQNNWVFETNYSNYKDFLSLYDDERLKYSFKLPHGDGSTIMYSDKDMQYPIDVDPTKKYIKFIKSTIQEKFPLIDIEEHQTWWLDYPAHTNSYAGIHRHQSSDIFTTVLFLETDSILSHLAEPGCLFAFLAENGQTELYEWEPTPGLVVLMDGMVYHGTYPTQFKRRVLVCDFKYKVKEG